MKRQAWGAALLVVSIGMTGCGGNIKLNEKQNAEAAEYASGLVLKYDKNYEDTLIYPDATEEPTPGPTKQAVASSQPEATMDATSKGEGSNGETGKNPDDTAKEPSEASSLTEVIGAKGFEVTCKKVKTASEYKEKGNDAYAIYPAKGKKLAIASFRIKNTTGSDKKIFLTEKGIEYRLVTSDGKGYSAELSVVSADMNFLNMRVKAGKSKEGVVLFQIPESVNVKGAQINVTNGAKSIAIVVN